MKNMLTWIAAAACATASLHANLLQNGDFESPGGVVGWRFLSASPGDFGWSIHDTIDILGTGWQPASGAQSIDLNGWGLSYRGAVYQDIPTVVGATYYLSFAIAGNPEDAPRVKNVRVWWGTEVALIDFDVTGRTVGNMGWVYYEYGLVAQSASTRVAFESLDATACGPTLDDVVVSLSARSSLTPSLPPVCTPPGPTPGYPPGGRFPGYPPGTGTDPSLVQWTDNGAYFLQPASPPPPPPVSTPDTGATLLLLLGALPMLTVGWRLREA